MVLLATKQWTRQRAALMDSCTQAKSIILSRINFKNAIMIQKRFLFRKSWIGEVRILVHRIIYQNAGNCWTPNSRTGCGETAKTQAKAKTKSLKLSANLTLNKKKKSKTKKLWAKNPKTTKIQPFQLRRWHYMPIKPKSSLTNRFQNELLRKSSESESSPRIQINNSKLYNKPKNSHYHT